MNRILPVPPNVASRTSAHPKSIRRSTKIGSTVSMQTEHGFRPLVGNSELCYRVLTPQPRRNVTSTPDFMAVDGIEARFGSAFQSVWQRLPALVRNALIGYWRRSLGALASAEYSAYSGPIPLIQIVFAGVTTVEAISSHFGHWLSFPAAIISEPDRLEQTIVRVLAQVYRYSTGAHGQLVDKLIERPFGEWETRQTRPPSFARRQQKLDELEPAYLRDLEAEMRQLLESWGFTGT